MNEGKKMKPTNEQEAVLYFLDCDSYEEIFDILEKLFGGNCHENC